jgi:hypothetical protein
VPARVIVTITGAYIVWAILDGGISAPRLRHARMYAQEVAVIAAVRTINVAQTQYRSKLHRFAGSFRELAAADIITDELASGAWHGYDFLIAATRDRYTIDARPNVFNSNGSRTFYSDQTMVIHEHYGPEPATAQDPVSKD